MTDLYSIAINGAVVAENMRMTFATKVIEALVASDPIYRNVDEITIQRVREEEE